jgi:uncharacterized protein
MPRPDPRCRTVKHAGPLFQKTNDRPKAQVAWRNRFVARLFSTELVENIGILSDHTTWTATLPLETGGQDMAHYLELDTKTLQHPPLILVLAGGRQRRRHFWRSLELTGIDYRTVDIDGGQKSAPPKSAPPKSGAPKSGAQTSGARTTGGYTSDSLHRNTLVNRISLAVYRARRPVVLVAHGIGCVVAAWWAEYERPACGNPVLGAVLVEPPDVDRPGTDPVLARLGSCPRGAWPFPSFLVSDIGQEDALRRSHRMLAADWGSRLAEITRDPRMARMSAHGPAPEARLVARLLAESGIAPRAVVADSARADPVTPDPAPADMAPAEPMFGHAGRPRSLPQRIGDAVGQIVRW